jgi:uncharacterized protein (DUF2267 family)
MHVFNGATEKANVWIKDMMAELGTDDPRAALHALRAGLHALRDRLGVEEAADLSAQLPLVIRGLFFENWHPAGKPLRIRNPNDFLALVIENYAPRTDFYADQIVLALFRLLRKHVTAGELGDVVMSLPQSLAEMVGGRHEADW